MLTTSCGLTDRPSTTRAIPFRAICLEWPWVRGSSKKLPDRTKELVWNEELCVIRYSKLRDLKYVSSQKERLLKLVLAVLLKKRGWNLERFLSHRFSKRFFPYTRTTRSAFFGCTPSRTGRVSQNSLKNSTHNVTDSSGAFHLYQKGTKKTRDKSKKINQDKEHYHT